MNLVKTTAIATALLASQGNTDNLATQIIVPKVSTAACKAVGGGIEKNGTCGFFGADGSYFIATQTLKGCNLELAAPTTGFKQYQDPCDEVLKKVGSLRKQSKV